eukprot:7366212-Prymnesium_polylepis.2
MGLNAQQRTMLFNTGCIQPKGAADLTLWQSVNQTSAADCFLHASRDRLVATWYAHQRAATRGQYVIMIDVRAVLRDFGGNCAIDVSDTKGRASANIPEASRAGSFARRDFELLLRVPYLSAQQGHIIHAFDTSALALPGMVKEKDDVLTSADADALRVWNTQVAVEYRRSLAFGAAQERRAADPRANRGTLMLATDASRVEGADIGVTAALSVQRATGPSTFRQQRQEADNALCADIADGDGRAF